MARILDEWIGGTPSAMAAFNEQLQRRPPIFHLTRIRDAVLQSLCGT
jgi:uncharacterized membrane protein